MEAPKIITTQDAARLLGYEVQHVRRLLRWGRLEGQKLGRDWAVIRDSVDQYLAARDNLRFPLKR
jgi:excisionase family DNA binding protein